MQSVFSDLGDRKPAVCLTTFAPSANSSDVVRALDAGIANPECPVLGGLSADHREFARTLEFAGTRVLADSLPVMFLCGDVKVGWDEAAVYMAWGRPARKLAMTGRKAELSEELRYRFEVDPYGDVVVWTPKSKTEHSAAVLYQVQVIVDDGRVAKMVRTDCVPNWNYCNDIKWTKGS